MATGFPENHQPAAKGDAAGADAKAIIPDGGRHPWLSAVFRVASGRRAAILRAPVRKTGH